MLHAIACISLNMFHIVVICESGLTIIELELEQD